MQITVRNPEDLKSLYFHLGNMQHPFRCTFAKGEEDRTKAQNRLVHKWFGEIAAHRKDVTAMEVKAECNWIYGKPILRRDDPEWAGTWTALIEPLPYEKQLKAVRVFDIPFTRNMTLKQLREYMDQMKRDYAEQGIRLTDPEQAAQRGER